MILFDETRVSADFPGGTVVKSPPANAGDAGSIPSLGRFRCLGASNLCPVTAEPVLQSPGAVPAEPSCCNRCSPRTLERCPSRENPAQCKWRKSVSSNKGPAQPKNK